MGINRIEDEVAIMDLDVTSLTGTMVMLGVGRGKKMFIVGALVVDHADAAILVPTENEDKAT